MALAVDNVASYDQALGGYSWVFTPVASVPQGILVYVTTYNTGGEDLITGVTYGGTALTQVGVTLQVTNADTVDGLGSVWHLPLNTLSGAQTVAVQKTGVPSSNSVSVMVVSYTTASGATPIEVDAWSQLQSVGTNAHCTITTSADAHITAVMIAPDLGSPSDTTPVAPVVDVLEDDWGIRMSNYGQIAGVQPANLYDTAWTLGSSSDWGVMNVAIMEGSATVAEPFGFQFENRRRRVEVQELPYQVTQEMGRALEELL